MTPHEYLLACDDGFWKTGRPENVEMLECIPYGCEHASESHGCKNGDCHKRVEAIEACLWAEHLRTWLEARCIYPRMTLGRWVMEMHVASGVDKELDLFDGFVECAKNRRFSSDLREMYLAARDAVELGDVKP